MDLAVSTSMGSVGVPPGIAKSGRPRARTLLVDETESVSTLASFTFTVVFGHCGHEGGGGDDV